MLLRSLVQESKSDCSSKDVLLRLRKKKEEKTNEPNGAFSIAGKKNAPFDALAHSARLISPAKIKNPKDLL